MSSRRQHKMTSSTAKVFIAACITGLIVGCGASTPKYKTYQADDKEKSIINSKPAYLQPAYTKLVQEGKRNEVLNLLEIGKISLSKGNVDEAEKAFERAIREIETVYADSEQAAKARSLWYEEGSKNFKGEPYERSMAYFYRGIIYLYRNEPDNARASFLSGLMQDAFAEEEQNRSDFALHMFMAGWASQLMGAPDLAQEAFAELKQIRPDFEIPDSSHDTLVLAESGKSPRKLADGLGHYQLVFRRGKKIQDTRISLALNNETFDMYPMEDIFWQASSRGGRPVDAIVEGKAQFMQNAAAFGSGLSEVSNTALAFSGPVSSRTSNTMAALSLIGVASLALSANTKPRADTRYWKTLPDLVHVYTYNSSEIPRFDTVIHKNMNGDVVYTKSPDLIHSTPNHTLIWSGPGGQ